MTDKILALAQREIGTAESPAGSNNVKYNTAYYNRVINDPDYAWCAVFLWWLFQQVGQPELYYGGKKTAYCPTLLDYYRKQGWLVTENYQPGDIIFFNFAGKTTAAHVGICQAYDGTAITTIDGNTSVQSDVNGGSVMRRTRNKRYIIGAARPPYADDPENNTEGEEDMTQEQFNAMMDTYLSQLAQNEPSSWSEQARAWAEARGILSGDGAGNMQYKKFCTREELIQILYNQDTQAR